MTWQETIFCYILSFQNRSTWLSEKLLYLHLIWQVVLHFFLYSPIDSSSIAFDPIGGRVYGQVNWKTIKITIWHRQLSPCQITGGEGRGAETGGPVMCEDAWLTCTTSVPPCPLHSCGGGARDRRSATWQRQYLDPLHQRCTARSHTPSHRSRPGPLQIGPQSDSRLRVLIPELSADK